MIAKSGRELASVGALLLLTDELFSPINEEVLSEELLCFDSIGRSPRAVENRAKLAPPDSQFWPQLRLRFDQCLGSTRLFGRS
jgi:hypothetical protein